MHKDLYEDNRKSWNAATRAHNSHKGDQEKFFREGGSTLYPEDIELLGNISGLKVVHLLCNSGQDTLSLAQLGAIATGVDISDEAISFAQQLSQDSGVLATFYRADVLDWLAEAATNHAQFDIVYCSYGVVHWISDLNLWAKEIASILKPGGRFILLDFHPVTFMFDRDWNRSSPYFPTEKIDNFEEGVNDYVARDFSKLSPFPYQTGVEHFENPHPSHTFIWTLGEIVTAIGQNGLCIETLKEYPHTIGVRFNRMRQISDRRLIPPEDMPNLPLLYGIVARKI